MKLNLGCGTDIRPGYVNIDANTFLPGVDHVVDLTAPMALADLFPPASVDAVLAQDVLEHLHRWEALRLLGRLRALLKPGGTLEVRVPDAAGIIASADPVERKLTMLFGGQDVPQGTGMDQHRVKHPEFFCHHYAWSGDRLASALRDHGFVNIQIHRAGSNLVANAQSPT